MEELLKEAAVDYKPGDPLPMSDQDLELKEALVKHELAIQEALKDENTQLGYLYSICKKFNGYHSVSISRIDRIHEDRALRSDTAESLISGWCLNAMERSGWKKIVTFNDFVREWIDPDYQPRKIVKRDEHGQPIEFDRPQQWIISKKLDVGQVIIHKLPPVLTDEGLYEILQGGRLHSSVRLSDPENFVPMFVDRFGHVTNGDPLGSPSTELLRAVLQQ